MFEGIDLGSHFWYAIKRWRHREKLKLGEDSAWVLLSGE